MKCVRRWVGCVCSCNKDFSTVGHCGTPIDSLSIRVCAWIDVEDALVGQCS